MPRENLIQVRRGSKSEWTSVDPTLSSGEIGFETDTYRLKIGNGSSSWTELDYIGSSEDLIRVKNISGSSIQKGQAVYFSGYDTYNNVPTIAPYISNNTISEKLFAGLISDYASDGDYAFIINFGMINSINTTGATSNIASGNETWSSGDILYVNQHEYGKLTKVKPDKNIVLVGIIVHANASGSILVRSSISPRLSQLNEINFGNLSDDNIIKYNSNTSNWYNSPELDGGVI
jgi:hypothetical protein